jgi:hypothetical protein
LRRPDPDPPVIPLWLKLAYTAMAAAILIVYWFRYGPANYLWLSDVALILLVPALWLESALLTSVVAAGTLALELFWVVDLLARLLFGHRSQGLTGYMFDTGRPAWLRGLSLYHLVLPALTLWMLFVLGYDTHAMPAMLVLGWIVLAASWRFTDPDRNINWVHGFGGGPRTTRAPASRLLALMCAYPLLVWLPTHLALTWLFGKL